MFGKSERSGKLAAKSLVVCVTLISLTFAIQVNAIEPDTIVGIWMFDEGNGDLAGDSSGNGNAGNIVQAKWIDGAFGNALKFNGSAYVEVPASESLNSIEDEITIAAWIKFIDLSAWARVIIRGVFQDKNNLQFILACTDQPEIISLELHSEGQTFAVWTQHVLEQDVWHHIAYTSDGAQIKLYVDGIFKTSSGSGKPLNKPEDQSLFFGSGINAPGGAPGSAQKFKGALDEVAIFNVALSEDDINVLVQGIEEISEPVDSRGKLPATWGNMKIIYR